MLSSGLGLCKAVGLIVSGSLFPLGFLDFFSRCHFGSWGLDMATGSAGPHARPHSPFQGCCCGLESSSSEPVLLTLPLWRAALGPAVLAPMGVLEPEMSRSPACDFRGYPRLGSTIEPQGPGPQLCPRFRLTPSTSVSQCLVPSSLRRGRPRPPHRALSCPSQGCL